MNYEDLWAAFSWDAKDEFTKASLKEWMEEVDERVQAHEEDRIRDEKTRDALMTLLAEVMTEEEFSHYCDPSPEIPSGPEETAEIKIPRETIEALVAAVLKKLVNE